MSEGSGSMTVVRSIPLPAGCAAAVRASRSNEATSDAKIVFVIFTFLGLGVAGIARSLWFSSLSPMCAGVIAVACGMMAAVSMLLVNAIDWPDVREDLAAGMCTEATVSCGRAVRVRFAESALEGIALDCGDDVLLLIGEWWLSTNRLAIWARPKDRKRFPARQFCIRFLPRSGRVLAVDVYDGPLSVERVDRAEPVVAVQISKYAEVVHFHRTLKDLMSSAGA